MLDKIFYCDIFYGEVIMDKKRILMAEDEPHIARLIQFKLEREGFDVTWAKDGGEALSVIREIIPDLVLLDVMMPVMDGFDVLKKIKEDKRAPSGFEIAVEKFELIHKAEPFPINKDLNEELLGDRRHLWLRSRKMTAIMNFGS